jgi:hypothetical protein
MKYRVENVFIPETKGVAQLEGPNDKSQDLKGRRIIHVIDTQAQGHEGVRARVLTEEAE